MIRAGILMAALVLCGRAADDSEKPTGEDAKKKWEELHDQNLLVAEQQKLLTNQQGMLKQYLPTLPKGVTPGLERKGDVSVVAISLAHRALDDAAREIAEHLRDVQADELKCDAGKPCTKYTQIWLHGQHEAKALAQLPVFRTQLTATIEQLDKMLQKLQVPPKKDEAATGEAQAAFAAAALPGIVGSLAPLVETAFGIVDLFRSKVTITSRNVTAEESAVTALVAGKLRDLSLAGKIYAANEFPLAIADHGGILDDLTRLKDLSGQLIIAIRGAEDAGNKADTAAGEADVNLAAAQDKVKLLTARRDRAEELAAMSPDEKQRAYWDRVKTQTEGDLVKAESDAANKKKTAASLHQTAKDSAAALKRMRDFFDQLTGFQNTLYTKVDDDTALAKILRLEAIQAKWKACDERCGALELVVHALGTDTKEEANYFWDREKGSDGAVVSYALYQASTSSIWYAGESRPLNTTVLETNILV